MGIGMVVTVASGDADRVIQVCREAGAEAVRVGEVRAGAGVSFSSEGA
jgi:phosphoribosylaminoimidazole (AIR) synthetase